MKHKVQKVQKSQEGFTLIEIMIAVVVLAILGTISMRAMSAWVGATNVDVATYFVERDFVSAATHCYRINRNYTNCNKTQLTRFGLREETPWDTEWTVSVASKTFTLTIPVTNTQDGQDLATRLSNSDAEHVNSAALSGSNVSVSLVMP